MFDPKIISIIDTVDSLVNPELSMCDASVNCDTCDNTAPGCDCYGGSCDCDETPCDDDTA